MHLASARPASPPKCNATVVCTYIYSNTVHTTIHKVDLAGDLCGDDASAELELLFVRNVSGKSGTP